jgi:cyclopropane fatty-acyl-phospholipid synthase-like methyltransferase
MIEQKHYTREFFTEDDRGALSAARVVLPIINRIVGPKSVIDIGCGVGNWLKVWMENLGVHDVLGVEGPYIGNEVLQIPRTNMILQDLKQTLEVSRRFDLAMSLEVAEHLPPENADRFVQTLTSLSDIILFSAAIPGQDGTYHINEQLPEYWAKKFIAAGYVPVDYIRDIVWGNPEVEWWYQQNIMLYVHKTAISNYPELQAAVNKNTASLTRIHPRLYFYKYEQLKKTRTIIGYIRWKLYPLKKWFTHRAKN